MFSVWEEVYDRRMVIQKEKSFITQMPVEPNYQKNMNLWLSLKPSRKPKKLFSEELFATD